MEDEIGMCLSVYFSFAQEDLVIFGDFIFRRTDYYTVDFDFSGRDFGFCVLAGKSGSGRYHFIKSFHKNVPPFVILDFGGEKL